MKELNVECDRAQEPRDQVRLTPLPMRRTTSSTTWTLTSRRRRLPRSGSSRLWQNPSWRDSTASGPTRRDHHEARLNKEGCIRQGHEDEERRSPPAQLRRRSSFKESAQSTRKLESMVRKESRKRAQRAKDNVFHEVAGRAQAHCTGSWRSTKPFTTIKSNEMKPMNLQEEVGKLEDQESAVNVASPMEYEASWEMSTFLNTIDNLKISPEGLDSVTRTVSRARMRFRTPC